MAELLFQEEDENMSKKPTVLMILTDTDSVIKQRDNAVALTKTPVMDALEKEYPSL